MSAVRRFKGVPVERDEPWAQPGETPRTTWISKSELVAMEVRLRVNDLYWTARRLEAGLVYAQMDFGAEPAFAAALPLLPPVQAALKRARDSMDPTAAEKAEPRRDELDRYAYVRRIVHSYERPRYRLPWSDAP